jgi:hypothetical protein
MTTYICTYVQLAASRHGNAGMTESCYESVVKNFRNLSHCNEEELDNLTRHRRLVTNLINFLA